MDLKIIVLMMRIDGEGKVREAGVDKRGVGVRGREGRGKEGVGGEGRGGERRGEGRRKKERGGEEKGEGRGGERRRGEGKGRRKKKGRERRRGEGKGRIKKERGREEKGGEGHNVNIDEGHGNCCGLLVKSPTFKLTIVLEGPLFISFQLDNTKTFSIIIRFRPSDCRARLKQHHGCD